MTAVYFLYKQLESIRMDYNQRRISAEQAINSRAEVLEFAKQMERQQIIDAFKSGDCNGTFETISSEEYYKETFKKL